MSGLQVVAFFGEMKGLDENGACETYVGNV
jgi:hypothetical protein